MRKKRPSLRRLTTSSWLKSYWFNYTWENKPVRCQACHEYSPYERQSSGLCFQQCDSDFYHYARQGAQSRLSSVRFHQVCQSHGGLRLQRALATKKGRRFETAARRAEGCVPAVYTAPVNKHAVCLAEQDWQESRCRKITLFQAWPS